MEGWGENGEHERDENLPEGWWQTIDNKDMERVIKDDTKSPKSKKEEGEVFKFKKSGKLNKAEVQELKRTCNSILDWVKVPAIPPPSPPVQSSKFTQDETYDMEWEEMGREEKLEKARKKKEKWEVARVINMIIMESVEKATSESENSHVKQILEDTLQEGWRRIKEKDKKKEKAKKKKEKWEITRIVKLITMEVVEEAVSQSEKKHIEEIMEDTLQEGWMRIETTRILQILEETEEEVQARVMEACLRKKKEEKNLLAALRLEEEKQRRLERTRILKLILSKKLGARELRRMVSMMNDALGHNLN